MFEAVGAHAAGRITDEELTEIEEAASPGAGACGGQFTANTMAMAFEVLGISPIGLGGPGRQTRTRSTWPRTPGGLVMDVLRRGQRPSEIITRDGLENAIAAVARQRRLDQRRPAPARRRQRERASSSTIDDFDRISERTPLLCDLKPGGRFVAPDLYAAGGVPLVLKRLKQAGLLHEDAQTVTGKTVGEHADEAAETEGQEVVRPLEQPDQGHRRARDPARQPRARGLRGQARRPRAAQAHRAGAGVRVRGGRDGGRHAARASRPATSS